MKSYRALVLASGSAVFACGTQPDPQTPTTAVQQPAAVSPAPEPIRPAPDDGVKVAGDLLPPIPVAVTSFGAARAGEHLYLLGGYHGTPHKYDSAGQSKGLWRLRLDAKGRWEQVSELDEGLQGLALVTVGDEVCRIGGTRILNKPGELAKMLSIADVACFHTANRTWRALPPLPSGRSSHEATVIDKTIWVAGGWRLGGDSAEGGGPKTAVWQKDAVSLDMSAKEPAWVSTPAPFQRRALDVSTRNGEVFVIGGLEPSREVSQSVDILNPRTGRWRKGPEFPTSSFGVAATELAGKIYASARDGVVVRLDDDSWSQVAKLTFPRFFHQLLAHEDSLVAVSGITGMQSVGRTRHTERVVLSAKSPRIEQWEMPFRGASKNRQGILLSGDALYLFGGNNSLGQHDFEVDNFLDEGLRIHLPSMRIDPVAAYPAKRQTMQTLSANAFGVSLGGFGHPQNGVAKSKAVSHAEGYVFDFESESWKPRGGLPRGRTQFGLTEHDGTLWVFGGLNYDPARKGKAAFEHVTTILTAPLAGDEPFEVANVKLPEPRRAFAGAALGGHYYMIGGMAEGFQMVAGCRRFSFQGRRFEEVACPGDSRLSGDLVALNGKLYLLGGSIRKDGKMTSARSIEVFDPATGAWSRLLDDVGFDTKHMRAMAYRDRLLLLSTHMSEKRLRVMLIAP